MVGPGLDTGKFETRTHTLNQNAFHSNGGPMGAVCVCLCTCHQPTSSFRQAGTWSGSPLRPKYWPFPSRTHPGCVLSNHVLKHCVRLSQPQLLHPRRRNDCQHCRLPQWAFGGKALVKGPLFALARLPFTFPWAFSLPGLVAVPVQQSRWCTSFPDFALSTIIFVA